jgi:hypothetical protein
MHYLHYKASEYMDLPNNQFWCQKMNEYIRSIGAESIDNEIEDLFLTGVYPIMESVKDALCTCLVLPQVSSDLPNLLTDIDDIAWNVVHELFFKIRRKEIKDIREFIGKMKQNMNQRIRAAIRKMSTEPVKFVPIEDLIDIPCPITLEPANEIECREIIDRIVVLLMDNTAIGSPLTELQRSVIKAHYLDAKSIREIAAAMERSRTAIQEAINRGIQNLSECFREPTPHPAEYRST